VLREGLDDGLGGQHVQTFSPTHQTSEPQNSHEKKQSQYKTCVVITPH
jgi:hypothetical protein